MAERQPLTIDQMQDLADQATVKALEYRSPSAWVPQDARLMSEKFSVVRDVLYAVMSGANSLIISAGKYSETLRTIRTKDNVLEELWHACYDLAEKEVHEGLTPKEQEMNISLNARFLGLSSFDAMERNDSTEASRLLMLGVQTEQMIAEAAK